jgi:predicted transposase YbfD/YdcC
MSIAASLLEALSELPDPRLERGKEHRWSELLFIAVCTLLTGGESFYDMEDFAAMREEWLRAFLVLPGGPPSHDTFNRLFQMLDPAAFADSFARWTEGLRGALPVGEREIVALDGKAARRALSAGEDTRYLVSAWATEQGLTLGQVQVADKSNEITAVPPLLRALELTGCVVTADALHCQKNTAKEIVEADADYVLALKGNQGVAHQEIKDWLDDAIARADPTLAKLETLEKGHGRIETRRYWQSADIDWFVDRAAWENLQSVGVVESTREINGKTSVERRYYLSSLPEDASLFARAVRGHWAVENNLHWVLDVVFGEDQSRARTGFAVANLGMARRLALNLLRQDKTPGRSTKRKQMRAAFDLNYLQSLLKL